MEVKRMEPQRVVDIFSEKYSIAGQIQDYGVVTKLTFTYDGREHELGIGRHYGDKLAEAGLQIMETAIDKLLNSPNDVVLHYWYIKDDWGEKLAHGIVTGHPRLPDSHRIHTTPIIGMELDEEREELLITTLNTLYHCPLSSCRFKKQDAFPDMLPDYEKLKEKYYREEQEPEIEQGKVLLVLSNFDEYYFHSLCVKDENGEKINYTGFPHVGMFQDSYLIETDDYRIDLRYFPHFGNIEFYECETDGMPLYAENIGSSVIYISISPMTFGKSGSLTFSLKPGERKELTEKNAEQDVPDLPDGDLYPAGT